VAAEDAAALTKAAEDAAALAVAESEQPASADEPGAASPDRRMSPRTSVPYSPLTPLRPAFAVAVAAMTDTAIAARDGKIAAGLVQWQQLTQCDADARPDGFVFDHADALIRLLCDKVGFSEDRLLGRPSPAEPSAARQTATTRVTRRTSDGNVTSAFGEFLTRMGRWMRPEEEEAAEAASTAEAAEAEAAAAVAADLSLQAAKNTLADPAALLAQPGAGWSETEVDALNALKLRARAHNALQNLSGVLSTAREEQPHEETVQAMFIKLLKRSPDAVPA